MVATVERTQREFQGTISTQVRVQAEDRFDADRKLRDLADVLAIRVPMDVWDVPLIRDMEATGPNAETARYNVTVTFAVDAPSHDTAECTANQFASHVVVASDMREEVTEAQNAHRRADFRAQRAQGVLEYALVEGMDASVITQREQEVDHAKQAVAAAEAALKAAEEKRGTMMVQGVIVDYAVTNASRN